jgi:hypothetical protein
VCLFTHVAAGALAGALAPSPVAAPLFALGSHVLLDILPHHDIERMRWELLLAAAAVAAIALGGALELKVGLGIAFGILPDLENLFWKLGAIRDDQKIFPGHRTLIPHGAYLGVSNLFVQAAFSAAVVLLLIRRGA